MNAIELQSKIDSIQAVLLELQESDLDRKEKKRRIRLANRRLRNAFKKKSYLGER